MPEQPGPDPGEKHPGTGTTCRAAAVPLRAWLPPACLPSPGARPRCTPGPSPPSPRVLTHPAGGGPAGGSASPPSGGAQPVAGVCSPETWAVLRSSRTSKLGRAPVLNGGPRLRRGRTEACRRLPARTACDISLAAERSAAQTPLLASPAAFPGAEPGPLGVTPPRLLPLSLLVSS